MIGDTIAAIATPIGEAGLAVVRISGSTAIQVADKCFRPGGQHSKAPSLADTHTVHYGHVHRAGVVVDEVLLTVMRAPRTFTREDCVEITCHGGMLAVKCVLDTVLECGARLAEPGEFTRRAFLNGRLDLAQAEAVADLIHARTELALTAAQEQLAGKLSARINRLRDDLLNILAHVEAHIDFPEEDIAPDTRAGLLQRLGAGMTFMDELLRTSKEGRILRQGIRAAIIGRPNVGKSSLLNQLLGHDRAIVSPIAGTTRDTIQETASIRGIPVIFVDTAGLREARDPLEQEGVRRTHQTVSRAELVLQVLDNSQPLASGDEAFLSEIAGRPRILVRNKADLPEQLVLAEQTGVRQVRVSSLTGSGIEELKDAIAQIVWGGQVRSDMLEVMINSRHQDALRRARDAADSSATSLRDDLHLEIVALDLRIAVNAVGEVVGKTATEDLLDSIFSQFCIGK